MFLKVITVHLCYKLLRALSSVAIDTNVSNIHVCLSWIYTRMLFKCKNIAICIRVGNVLL